MVKAKGSVNIPMVQLVEVVLQEESAIRSERVKKGQFGNQGTTNVQYQRVELSIEKSEWPLQYVTDAIKSDISRVIVRLFLCTSGKCVGRDAVTRRETGRGPAGATEGRRNPRRLQRQKAICRSTGSTRCLTRFRSTESVRC